MNLALPRFGSSAISLARRTASDPHLGLEGQSEDGVELRLRPKHPLPAGFPTAAFQDT
jgi:hypothetical protein